jgi:hypothetical protein
MMVEFQSVQKDILPINGVMRAPTEAYFQILDHMCTLCCKAKNGNEPTA